MFKTTLEFSLVYRLLIEDSIHLIMFYSAVLAWKFYWNAIDFLIVNEKNQLYVCIGFHMVPFLLALMTKTSAMLVGPGTSFLDGERIQNTANVYFELNYLNALFMVRIIISVDILKKIIF